MTDETRRWFIEKIAQNPEYLERVYLPAMDKSITKAELALREANRSGTLDQIKYRQGWLDGAQKLCAVIDGLRISEHPAEPGLMARMLSGFSRSDSHSETRAESA